MQILLAASRPAVPTRKRIKMQSPCSSASSDPLFSPSAAAMTRKVRVGPRPTRRFAIRLPMETSIGDSHSTFDVISHALHEMQGLNDEDETHPPLAKKRVYFNLHLNHEIEADSASPLSDDEIEQAWWRPRDYKASADLYSKEVRSYIENHKNSVDDLIEIVSQCNQSSHDELNERIEYSFCASSIPRGAESDLAPVIKLLRCKHRDAVMGYVNKIPKHLKPDLRERMLCARSIQYSRPHKMLARLLGEADALSCKQY